MEFMENLQRTRGKKMAQVSNENVRYLLIFAQYTIQRVNSVLGYFKKRF